MKYIVRYINNLFSETTILVSGIVGFVLNAILPSISYFSSWDSLKIGIIIFFICFLLANYFATKKLLTQLDTLSEENTILKRAQTDFKVNIMLEEFNFSEKEKVINSEIGWAKEQLAQINQVTDINYSGSVNIDFMEKRINGQILKIEEAYKKYLSELNTLNQFILKLKEKKYFYLNVTIQNTGDKYEEDIMVNITNVNSEFSTTYDLSLYDLEELPKRPFDFSRLSYVPSLNALGTTSEKNEHMTMLDNKNIKIDIAKLHAKKQIKVTNKTILLVRSNKIKLTNFDIKISSNNTKSPIHIKAEVK